MSLLSGFGQPAMRSLDAFTRAYIDAALWSSVDDDGVPLDRNYGPDDIAPDTLTKMVSDARNFQAENADMLSESDLSDEKAGHAFWLDRNGHGTGFWDQGDEPVFEKLHEAAHAYGTFDLYVGDDGLIYGS